MDDYEPVTEEWMGSLSLTEYRGGWRVGGCIVVWRVLPDGVFRAISWVECEYSGWQAHAKDICDLPTRGHVRRLCSALGTPLGVR